MAYIKDNRAEALNVGFFATDWSIDIDYELYEQVMQDWNVRGIYRDDRCIGAVFQKGKEVHVSILPEFRKKWLTKGLLKQLLGDEEIMTQIAKGHDYMEEILMRIGFVKNGNEFVRSVSHGS
jgi:hypothetical protein